ncbi:glycerophosphodiester phosphodiesterase family protein [Methylopila sp. 73B]|uniref:glycerophosphodiester phosphodiesterase family protein n=1 Tax=Methylopila sp. 73B TaxID=1120792 RepID=UPI0003601A0E|nr:glycerophosphodiester phosphodiesterase family protein [Methylopila sp. 73B]
MASRLSWLVARPIAHRGLHDRAAGVIENTSSAVQAAVDHGFGVEIDVQVTADGEAVVFHDSKLDRLTEASGLVADRPLRELVTLNVGGGADRIWTLAECLDLVGGKVPLVVEVKTSRGGDTRLARRVAELLSERGGPVAAKSFDPRVLVLLRSLAPRTPRGVVGDAFDPADAGWAHLSGAQRFVARNMLHWRATKPDFVSWNVRDLTRRSVRLSRSSGVPVMAWTVRTPEDQARAALGADQMVFEGFVPALTLGTGGSPA